MDVSQKLYHNVPTPAGANLGLSVVTPGGGLLYAGIRCINFIGPPPGPGQIKTMSTRINITALDVSPVWSKPNEKTKPFAVVGEDLSVQVWDCEQGEAVIGHKAHQHQQESARNLRMNSATTKVVLMGYLANGNILSIDANDLVIYCVASNTYCRRPTFISPRNHQFSTLKCSPYSEHMFALGTVMGNVLICDLRKMTILHKFHAHKAKVCGLAWREIKLEEQKVKKEDQFHLTQLADQAEQWRIRNGQNTDRAAESSEALNLVNHDEQEGGKALPSSLKKIPAVDDSDAFDIYNFDHLKEEFGAPSEIRVSNSTHDGNTFVGLENPSLKVSNLDFIEECKSIKEDLQALKIGEEIPEPTEVTLDDCQEAKLLAGSPCHSDDDDNISGTLKDEDSTEGSLEVIQYSSSSDDAVIVDGEAAKPKRQVLHHIYHQAEVHETPAGVDDDQAISSQVKAPQMTRQESFDTLSSVSMAVVPHSDILLVSIDADEVIMIWNANTGAHCGKNYSKFKAAGKPTSTQWLNDRTIVTLSRYQLFFWSLTYDETLLRYKFNKDNEYKCYQRDIIAFSCTPTTNQVWVCMNTRKIALLDSSNGQVTDMFGTINFGVRALAECPDDMNKIALGCADKRIAFLDVFKLSTRNLIIDSIGTAGSVYSLAWSPNCLNLAFGTGDGLVGIIDVERMKTKEVFRTPYKNEIYSLSWCNNYIFFVVNRLFGYVNLDKPKREVTMLDYISRPCYFSARGSFLFVGTTEGFLQLHERKDGAELGFQFVRQSALLSRYITDIAWNPLERQQFAVVGHDVMIYVMEFIESEKNWKKLHVFTATSPKASITSLKWSYTQSNLLLTFHIEGKVCLWNTKEPEQPPLTIIYHCPMWGGMFLPTNDKMVMCVGKTLSLELVNITEANKNKIIQSKVDALLNVKWASKSMNQPLVGNTGSTASERKRKLRDKKKLAKTQNQIEEVAQIHEEHKAIGKSKAKSVEDMFNSLSLESKPLNESPKFQNLDAHQTPDKFMSHSRTCLYLVQKELNRDALEKLAIVLTEDSSKIDNSVFISKLFSTKVVAKDLVAAELTNLKQSNKKDIAPLCLALSSTSKLREELEQHMANQTLNEWHISLAPSVSFMFWQDCCRSYAKQLENQGYILHAATYLFGIGLQMGAINLLVEHEFYKEALLHARVSLPATDPTIKTIINKWLEQLEKTGNYAAAALICVLDNEMLRGYTYLRKYHNCTAEIAGLMEDIKRIGQLNAVLEGCVLPKGVKLDHNDAEPTHNGNVG